MSSDELTGFVEAELRQFGPDVRLADLYRERFSTTAFAICCGAAKSLGFPPPFLENAAEAGRLPDVLSEAIVVAAAFEL